MTPRHRPTERNDGLLEVVTAAYDANLKMLVLTSSCMAIKEIAALCSALRYGCQIEAINLNSALFYTKTGDGEQCWRWLAYAIFYPRSKKLVAKNTFHHIEMGTPFEANYCAAFINTLSDPARELVYQGLLDSGAPKDEILIFTIKQGAKFYAASQVTHDVLYELEHEKTMEALCEQEDWACVVLPGVGLGWVASDQIVSIERERIDRSSVSVEWGFKGLTYWRQPSESLLAFIEHVGCHLSYLSLDRCHVGSQEERAHVLATILRYCVNLKHLRLYDSEICDVDVDLLVDVLNGDLGGRLLSLDLNANDISSVEVNQLSAFLSNRTNVRALIELRLCVIYHEDMTAKVYANLRLALAVNRKLQFLELMMPADWETRNGRHNPEYAVAMVERNHLEHAAQREVLSVKIRLASWRPVQA